MPEGRRRRRGAVGRDRSGPSPDPTSGQRTPDRAVWSSAVPAPDRIRLSCLAVLSGLAIAACGSSNSSSSRSANTGASPAAVTTAGSTTSASTGIPGCTPSTLKLHSAGVLTVATDSPAYPPYFENNKPANGKGFESAVAYAVAAKLGFPRSQVKWVVEPFDSSYAPGPKSFDFDINEISITKPRAQEVDFSTPYYTNPQGIIVASNSSLAHATSLSAFK